ncbi:putative 5'-3' exonuclease, N-terminal resolvase-like domain [Babesia divergens]|uniref:5'-3' exonuclease, N-terminal resolvase-like domain n=1 Tax=Babesia divergens TaxID=32595 RepID=A0AAD9LLR4_BABDI|nr:putative 5'-3' exonuclease, N-terminal resolvase-like domain [Babesia divergens]
MLADTDRRGIVYNKKPPINETSDNIDALADGWRTPLYNTSRSIKLGVGKIPCFLIADFKDNIPRSGRLFGRRKKVQPDSSDPITSEKVTKPTTARELRDRVLLVDGTGLAYRCFFALPTLTTYRGTEIGAIVGFMNSLARLYRTIGPKYVGIAFDSPGANNSKRAVWPEYKTNRQVIKTSFKKQLLWIKEFCAIVGLPVFLKRTTEADDIISSMIAFLRGNHGDVGECTDGDHEVQKMRPIEFRVPEGASGGVFDRMTAADPPRLEPLDDKPEDGIQQKKFDVYVLTADKDLLQVLEHNESGNVNVRIVQPHKKFRIVDEDTVLQEYGIPPGRFSEYLALVGDAADNIPGVMGIGPKTAPVLISKYGTFKEIIDSDEISKIAKKGGKHSLSVERAYDFHLITKLRNDVSVLSSIRQLCKRRTLERQFVEFCKLFSLQKCSQRWHDVTH